MMFLMDPEFWARVFGIIVIDLTLAGDNALVIALAVRTLPKRQQFLGRIWGTLGAVGLRLAFITVATFLMRIPFLQVVGGVLLLWIAFKLVHKETGAEEHVRQGGSLREAVWIIIVADAVMSLDNVLAVAAAAHGDMRLVVFGIALSLPIVVWGSGILATFMNRCYEVFTKRFCSAMNLGGLTIREVAVRTWTKMNEHEVLTRAAAITSRNGCT